MPWPKPRRCAYGRDVDLWSFVEMSRKNRLSASSDSAELRPMLPQVVNGAAALLLPWENCEQVADEGTHDRVL